MNFSQSVDSIVILTTFAFVVTTVRRQVLLMITHPYRNLALIHLKRPPYPYLVVAGSFISGLIYSDTRRHLLQAAPTDISGIKAEHLQTVARVATFATLLVDVFWIKIYYKR